MFIILVLIAEACKSSTFLVGRFSVWDPTLFCHVTCWNLPFNVMCHVGTYSFMSCVMLEPALLCDVSFWNLSFYVMWHVGTCPFMSCDMLEPALLWHVSCWNLPFYVMLEPTILCHVSCWNLPFYVMSHGVFISDMSTRPYDRFSGIIDSVIFSFCLALYDPLC